MSSIMTATSVQAQREEEGGGPAKTMAGSNATQSKSTAESRPTLTKRTSSKSWKLLRDSFAVRRDRKKDLWDAILQAIGESKKDVNVDNKKDGSYTFLDFQRDLDVLRCVQENENEELAQDGSLREDEEDVDDETTSRSTFSDAIDRRASFTRTFRRGSIVASLELPAGEMQLARYGKEPTGGRHDKSIPAHITSTSSRRLSDLTVQSLSSVAALDDSTKGHESSLNVEQVTMDGSDPFRLDALSETNHTEESNSTDNVLEEKIDESWSSRLVLDDSLKELSLDRSDNFRLNGLTEMVWRDGGNDTDTEGEEIDDFSSSIEPIPESERLNDESERSLTIDDFSSSIQPLRRRGRNRSSNERSLNGSAKRQAMSLKESLKIDGLLAISQLRNTEAFKDWASSFYHLDPRWQILTFFNDLALEGANNLDSTGGIIPADKHFQVPYILRVFGRAGVFSVWRPTSNDAIKKMMTGEGVGKGLDIKGKSALKGKYSGFVPFMQIHNNEDKSKVCSMTAGGRVRVFYPSKSSRDRAARLLKPLRDMMVTKTNDSLKIIEDTEEMEAKVLSYTMQKSFNVASARKKQPTSSIIKKVLKESRRLLSTGPMKVERGRFQEALEDKSKNIMSDSNIYKIDDYSSGEKGVYGLDVPEKLFWKGFVEQNDITRKEGSEHDTGRPSMPEFQSMNFDSLRKKPGRRKKSLFTEPRPVLYHAGCGIKGGEPIRGSNPLCPLGLLMAYEESDGFDGKVTPVVSDFDCFLLGTRGVQFSEPLGKQELSMMASCVDDIEGILATPEEGVSWTKRWLEVKKKHVRDEDSVQEMPKFGYADNRSYTMISGAVHRLRGNGAVRHGPECFNYGFPQDLDDKYLVISDTLPGQVPWKYVDSAELISILSEKIDEGFTFPLNPKWILCDAGWKSLYDKLLSSNKANVQDSMAIWYPDTIRSRIDNISTRFPLGFAQWGEKMERTCSGVSVDLAVLELQRYRLRRSSFQKAKFLLENRRRKLQESHPTLFSTTLDMLDMGREADMKKSTHHRGTLVRLSEHHKS